MAVGKVLDKVKSLNVLHYFLIKMAIIRPWKEQVTGTVMFIGNCEEPGFIFGVATDCWCSAGHVNVLLLPLKPLALF